MTEKTENQKTMDFLRELSEQAQEAAKAGDTLLANRLGNSRATQYYFTNVHMMRSVSEAQFERDYPQYMTEATRLRKEYEQAQASEERISSLESKLNEALEVIKTLTEANTETTTPAKKGKAKDEPEPTEES